MKRKILLTLTVICSMFIISCAPAGGNASEGSSQEMPEEAETLETAAEEIVVQETPVCRDLGLPLLYILIIAAQPVKNFF